MTSPPVSAEHRDRIIAYWLFIMCFMVFAMVVLGGVTRLTHSGLSMVEWKPVSGWLPPLNEAEWEATFAKYREFPEYKEVNKGMSLSEFQSIFWLEFLHRLWGRIIGVAFFVPFVFFFVRGWVSRALAPKLVLAFILGGLQGVLGWYMVKSGLVNEPDVSQYRLTAHLGAAIIIYGYMFWVALGLLNPDPHPAAAESGRSFWRGAVGLAILVFVTILSGGFVAGLDAGFAYNTFPTMDGDWLPDELFDLSPFYLNFFEHIPTVQFDHRILAELTFVLVMIFAYRTFQNPLAARQRLSLYYLIAALVVQVGLGISTLLLVVPVSLAAIHQAGAVVLFTAVLWMVHEMRPARG